MKQSKNPSPKSAKPANERPQKYYRDFHYCSHYRLSIHSELSNEFQQKVAYVYWHIWKAKNDLLEKKLPPKRHKKMSCKFLMLHTIKHPELWPVAYKAMTSQISDEVGSSNMVEKYIDLPQNLDILYILLLKFSHVIT